MIIRLSVWQTGKIFPPELGEEGEKMAELWMTFGSVMMKIQQYADHPEVQKAQEEMSDIFN